MPNAGRRTGRRQRWAAAENERRLQVYRAAYAAWQRYDAELRTMHATVVSFVADPGMAVPVPLDRGERAYLVVDGAQPVEAPDTGPLPAPLATPFPVAAAGGALPADLRPGEHGTVVVTDRRLIFSGPRTRVEWPYARLTGMRHDPAVPVTLLRADHQRSVSGVLLAPYAADGFRLLLQLAVADAGHGRRDLQAHLGQLIFAHPYQQPAPPTLADPGQAPVRAVVPAGRRMLITAAAVLGLLALVGGLGPRLAARPGPASAARFVGGSPAPGAAAHGSATNNPAGPDANNPVGPDANNPAGPAATGPAATGPAGPAATGPGGTDPGGTDPGGPVAGPAGPAVPAAASPGATAPAQSPAATQPPVAATPPATGGAPATQTPPRPPAPATPTTEATTLTTAALCGAPANPYGYTLCGGALITVPDPGVCSYFDCAAGFWKGKGYLMLCQDGKATMTGGRKKSCSKHDGDLSAVRSAA